MKRILMLSLAVFLCCSLPSIQASEQRQSSAVEQHRGKVNNESRTPGTLMLPISLPGSLALDVTLDFADVTDLSLTTAGISASVISSTDVSVTSRFPAGDVTIPSEFAVMLLVEPPDVGLSTLSFDGVYEITLLTADLPYFPGTKLRLFSAHDGGSFEDITHETSQGSYRVRGSGGSFSEFIIVLDNRDVEIIVDKKLADLDSLLSGYSGVIDSTVYTNLDSLVALVDSAWTKRDASGALTELDSFIAAVIAATPVEIPDNWDATGGSDNVAGILRAKAQTLGYSLDYYASPLRRQQ